MLANVSATYPLLTQHHYLGPTKAADFAWQDTRGMFGIRVPTLATYPDALA